MKRAIYPILTALAVFTVLPAAGIAQTPENPFTNAGGDGRAVEEPPPAQPSALPAAPKSPATAAAETGVPTGAPRPEAKPDFLLRMSREDCKRLVARSEVAGANYVPGVDVRGNAVQDADLAGTLTAADILPKEIAFELALNPLLYAGNSALADLFSNASTSLGTIKYDLSSGALTFNGKRLNDTTESEVLALCKSSLGL